MVERFVQSVEILLTCSKKKSKLRLFKNLSTLEGAGRGGRGGGMGGLDKKRNIPFPTAVQILFPYLKIAASKV